MTLQVHLMVFGSPAFLFLLIISVSATKFTNGVNTSTDILNQDNVTDIINRFKSVYPVKSWMDHGFFDYAYLKIINVHWLKFSPQNPLQHYSLAALYALIMLCGVTGNVLVIYMYLRTKPLQTSANVLVMNLALSDLLMMSKMPIFIYNSIFQGPALGDKVCRLYGFIGGLSGTCSICLLTTISINRFYVVKYPLKRGFTCFQAKICALFCWGYSTLFSIIPMLNLGLGSYTPEGFLTSCSYDYLSDSGPAKVFIFVFFLAAWVVPINIITFTYKNIIQIAIAAKRLPQDNTLAGDFRRHVQSETKHRQEVKLAKVVFMIISAWFFAWTPYAVVSLLGITGNGNLITPLGSMVPALFAKSASCVNPFIYALTNPIFKREIYQMFFRNASRLENARRVVRTVHYSTTRSTRKSNLEYISESDIIAVAPMNMVQIEECGSEDQ